MLLGRSVPEPLSVPDLAALVMPVNVGFSAPVAGASPKFLFLNRTEVRLATHEHDASGVHACARESVPDVGEQGAGRVVWRVRSWATPWRTRSSQAIGYRLDKFPTLKTKGLDQRSKVFDVAVRAKRFDEMVRQFVLREPDASNT